MEPNLINLNTNFEILLNDINNGKFEKKYSCYKKKKRENGFLIIQKEEKDKNEIFLFNEKIKIKLIKKDSEESIKEFEAFSSLEIENNLSSVDLKTSELFMIKGKIFQYEEMKINLGAFISNRILNIFVIPIEKVPRLNLKDIFKDDGEFKPEEFSLFFYLYFKYEDKNKKENKINYGRNKIREEIWSNILSLKTKNSLRTYKFTGPSSTGKSFTLFYLSRVLSNIIYVNFSVLNDNKNNLFKCYQIIIHELERIDIDNDKLNEINLLIQNSYEKQLSPLQLILIIMTFLFTNFKEDSFVFIFDQYKKKYMIDGFNHEISKMSNIKIVYCSSINDKDIREECILSWKKNEKNISEFNEVTQNFYFYFDDIYTYKQKNYNNNDYNNNILAKFNYIPKYIKMYEDNKKDDISFINEAKNKIEEKVMDFCRKDKNKYYDILVHLRYIIDVEYDFRQLSEVIDFCLLKFFKIQFYESKFKIKPIFPFMRYFINNKFNETICLNYFSNNLYKNNTIENESVKGCYFEESVKYGLQKLKLPSKYEKIITLREITEMEEIIDLDYYYIDNDEQSEEKKMDIDYRGNDNIPSNINGNIISFEKLLKEYKIDKNLIQSEILSYQLSLSKNTMKYSKNLDYFRLDEIQSRDNETNILINNNFDGNEALLLDQIKKTGKTLDYAFLYGDKYEKVFIGFQMKCYFRKSILKENVINKLTIREKCQKILVNSMTLFQCKITKWYYILIFYINDEITEENVNQENLEKCNFFNIHYIFYDPKKQIFKNSFGTEIKSLELTENSNLDYYKINIEYYSRISEIIREEGNIQIVGNLDNMIKSFVDDMKWMVNSEGKKLILILNQLSKIIQYELKFSVKINIIDDVLFFPPNNKHVYIYKISNECFILIQRLNDKNEFLDIKTRNKYYSYDIYTLFNKHCGYYYCLEKVSKLKKNK